MSSPTGEDTQDLAVDGQPWRNAAGGDPGAPGASPPPSSFDGAAHELAGLPARQPASSPPSAGLSRRSRPARAADPEALAPVRALAGAAVAVAGVALGIGTLLWASGSPDSADQGPVVRDSAQVVPAGEAQAQAPVAQPDGVPPDPQQPVAEPPAVEQPAAPPPAATEQPAAAPAPPPPPPPPAPAPAARPASVVVPVTVLNNSRRSGLAARAADRFEDGGWPVRETGNYTGRLPETTLYYAPGQEASAQSFARTFRGIGRVLPRFDGLPGQGLTVVLTRDFPA